LQPKDDNPLRGYTDIDAEDLSEAQLDRIAERFATPQECDRICREIFVANRWALHKTIEWSTEASPLMRRAAFVLMAALAEGENSLRNQIFYAFLPILERGLAEEDPLVSEAVIAAWRAIARRNGTLRLRVEAQLAGMKDHADIRKKI